MNYTGDRGIISILVSVSERVSAESADGGRREGKKEKERGSGLLKLSSSSVLLVPGLMYLKGAINADNMPTFSEGETRDTQESTAVRQRLHCFHSLIDKRASDGSASAHRCLPDSRLCGLKPTTCRGSAARNTIHCGLKVQCVKFDLICDF